MAIAASGDFDNAHADFGVAAVIGGSLTVRGIFDNGYVEAMGQFAGTGPVFECDSAAVASITVGTTVVIASTNYTLEKPPQPDGTGRTKLYLEHA